jgi:AbrB family looped-hinge helix DNA binding protein
MPVVTVSSKGQVVIPADVREKLALRAGDRLELRVEEDRVVLSRLREVQPESSWRAWRGVLREEPALESHLAEHAAEVAQDDEAGR